MPGIRDLTGPILSDGILFSEFLTGIFTQQVTLLLSDGKDCTYEDLTKVMATLLAEYIIGERKLLHPSSGTLVKVCSAFPQLEKISNLFELKATHSKKKHLF